MWLDKLNQLEDEQLGLAIGRACAGLPHPDPFRLAAIRDRLPLPKTPRSTMVRPSALRGWLLLALLGGAGLAAAWWGIQTYRVATQPVPVNPVIQQTITDPATSSNPPAPIVDPDKAAAESDSPIIYQRERY